MNKTDLLLRLWDDYITRNPYVKKVHDLFVSEGETVVNDHIAFRTIRHPALGIDVLSQPFINAGYKEKACYRFEEKHLFARHYEMDGDPTSPRVFISELIAEELSPELQQTFMKLAGSVTGLFDDPLKLLFAGNCWGDLSYNVYEALRAESEYAAWLYVNGYTVNHFTISVNYLRKFTTLASVNSFLKSHGYAINDAGGEIQGSPADLLEQSSVKAALVPCRFIEGEFEVTGCYYEFARRYPDSDGRLYPGFIARSADKIFQSTDLYKK